MRCGVVPSHTVGVALLPRIPCGVFGVVCGAPLPLWARCGALPPLCFIIECCVILYHIIVQYTNLYVVPTPDKCGAVWCTPTTLWMGCGVFGVLCGAPLPLWTWCGVLTPPHFVVWFGVACGSASPLWTWCGAPPSSLCGVVL